MSRRRPISLATAFGVATFLLPSLAWASGGSYAGVMLGIAISVAAVLGLPALLALGLTAKLAKTSKTMRIVGILGAGVSGLSILMLVVVFGLEVAADPIAKRFWTTLVFALLLEGTMFMVAMRLLLRAKVKRREENGEFAQADEADAK